VTIFDDLVRERTELRGEAVAHVRRLIQNWRTIADFAFSDLLLFAPIAGEEGHRFVVLAQVRSTTAQTLYPTDMVGTVVDEVARPLLSRTWRDGRPGAADGPVLRSGVRAHVECLPIRHEERMIGLLTREEWATPTRRIGELERYYRETFERFGRMIAEGSFPYVRDEIELEAAPTVSDGVIILDAETRIAFASPNAMSSLHRIGIHAYTQGALLREVGFDDSGARTALRARLPVAEEIERGDVSILLRVLPLLDAGRPTGAVLLIRDVTDLRRRDRMLISKDATIREIHHRVKNNLQTIASLLRLQTRRLDSDEARHALAESERRIRSIAIVHETLSHDAADVVAFGEIVRRLVSVVRETVVSDDVRIAFEVTGDAGDVPGEVATPLAVVVNELMQNAVDHAFPDGDARPPECRVVVELARSGSEIGVCVRDNGVGLREDFEQEQSRGLGLSIVRALVTGELGGSLELGSDHGTSVRVRVPVAVPRVNV
jgi:two-component sensor histidine kinase